MTAVTVDNKYDNTLTSQGVFRIVKFTTGTGGLPQTVALGQPGLGRTWLGINAKTAGGTAILYSVSGATATISSGPADSEICSILFTKY